MINLELPQSQTLAGTLLVIILNVLFRFFLLQNPNTER